MSDPLRSLYALLVRGARAASPLLAGGDSKLARGIRGRRGAAARLSAWARAERDPDRPLVWFHAPSVGEGLQARAVLEALASRRPEIQSVFTHFSPSAAGLAEKMPVDVADYLPWDVRDELVPVLEAVRPDVVAFTKTEVWPVLAREARRAGGRCALIGGTLPEGSTRLRWPARGLLSSALADLAEITVIAEEDGARFVELGADPGSVRVVGDPGIDSAARRAAGADPSAPYLRPFREPQRPTLVAGSTWPPDEEVLGAALGRVRAEHPDVRLVVAPHEPDESHLRPLEERLRRDGWTVSRLGEVEATGAAAEADAVVVDRVGVLAHLYTVGTMAFVGGGFHDEGLHSVLEPAAAGMPVLFGPRHHNARAAGDLVEAGGARVVADADALEARILEWLTDPGALSTAGRSARAYIEEHLGAADRTAERLGTLLR